MSPEYTPSSEMLGDMVMVSLAFWGTVRCFSTTASPLWALTKNFMKNELPHVLPHLLPHHLDSHSAGGQGWSGFDLCFPNG